MIAIGFAEKMFTLWECTDNGNFIRYSYIKNISSDKAIVESLYPGIKVDYSLKGHSHITVYKEELEEKDYSKFQFGKYAGTTISNCTDYEYLKWYGNYESYRGGNWDIVRECVMNILEPLGYRLVENEDRCHIYNPEEVAWIDKQDALKKSAKELVEYNSEIEVTITSNVHFTDNYPYNPYLDTDNEYLKVFVKDYKEMYYQGYPYYLPAINGKSKRLKNKTIKVSTKDYQMIDGVYYVKL